MQAGDDDTFVVPIPIPEKSKSRKTVNSLKANDMIKKTIAVESVVQNKEPNENIIGSIEDSNIEKTPTDVTDFMKYMSEFSNKIDKMFDDLKESIKISLTEIHQEVSTVRKMLTNYDEKQKLKKKLSSFYEHFPLSGHMEFDNLERKLAEQCFFKTMEEKLNLHVKNHFQNIGSVESYYKEILPVIFDKQYCLELAWTTFPGKKEISCSKIVHLLQSNYSYIYFFKLCTFY